MKATKVEQHTDAKRQVEKQHSWKDAACMAAFLVTMVGVPFMAADWLHLPVWSAQRSALLVGWLGYVTAGAWLLGGASRWAFAAIGAWPVLAMVRIMGRQPRVE